MQKIGMRSGVTTLLLSFLLAGQVQAQLSPERIQALVQSCEAAAGFTVYPTAMNELMAVADSGQVMPPKSTWFEPKLADGLIAHLIG